MKTLYFIALGASLAMMSCQTPAIKQPHVKEVTLLDYSEYTKKGFFFTEANSVSFDYSPIGSISAYSRDGFEVLESKQVSKKYSDDVTGKETQRSLQNTKYGDKYILASRNALLEEIYREALKSGANGVINLRVTWGYDNVSITGMAIKR